MEVGKLPEFIYKWAIFHSYVKYPEGKPHIDRSIITVAILVGLEFSIFFRIAIVRYDYIYRFMAYSGIYYITGRFSAMMKNWIEPPKVEIWWNSGDI